MGLSWKKREDQDRHGILELRKEMRIYTTGMYICMHVCLKENALEKWEDGPHCPMNRKGTAII